MNAITDCSPDRMGLIDARCASHDLVIAQWPWVGKWMSVPLAVHVLNPFFFPQDMWKEMERGDVWGSTLFFDTWTVHGSKSTGLPLSENLQGEGTCTVSKDQRANNGGFIRIFNDKHPHNEWAPTNRSLLTLKGSERLGKRFFQQEIAIKAGTTIPSYPVLPSCLLFPNRQVGTPTRTSRTYLAGHQTNVKQPNPRI